MGRFTKIGVRAAAGVAVATVAIWGWVLYRQGTIDVAFVRDAVAHSRVAPLLFIALQIAASLLFIPRTVLGIAAGLLFGLVWGAIWANLGAVLGAAAGFAFVRWLGGRSLDLEATPRLGPLLERAEQGGWRAVAMVRLLPFPHSVANTALALTKLSWSSYLVGSFLGMLPMTLVQVDIGAAGGAAFNGQSGWVIACVLLAVALGASFLLKRVSKNT